MNIRPYLFFAGSCEQALQFYQQAIGARVEAMMRYRDSPEPAPPGMVPPGFEDKVMHSTLRIGDDVVMAADDCMGKPQAFGGFALTINTRDEAEARKCFDALAAGGNVTMPLGKTFFSPAFGMLHDKFGVHWMVHVEQ